MKKCKNCIIFLSFLIALSSCQTIQEGMSGNKRTKSGDEFLVHKKKPLVMPPDFEDMPSPKPVEKKENQILTSNKSIEDLLNIKNEEEDETLKNGNNKSLEESILKKINKN